MVSCIELIVKTRINLDSSTIYHRKRGEERVAEDEVAQAPRSEECHHQREQCCRGTLVRTSWPIVEGRWRLRILLVCLSSTIVRERERERKKEKEKEREGETYP